ncbi:sulfur oxidation c-type cytochrome SoxX [Ramlibacter sp. XY19]|uniref:sulfur oxidation c-type cytochrome SoxX n=1 Tax=Ramlibacter paludis TaxID=2908000 RepID=UPI0023DB3A89|nr:sulfur oxidation c-type cytochrome SoxX [Ramlibacter paludis]MCG2593718.1 sulfur oxidation c-type cytochrome SoxX [Ramlibacter paludis]
MRWAVLVLWAGCVTARAEPVVPYVVEGDAIAQPLAGLRGDPTRGRALAASRPGLCLLCHTAPLPEERFQGNLAPDLAGAGARYSAGQLRLRVVDARRLNPQSLMPPFHALPSAARVGAAWTGQPIFSAQQVEDVVAWLASLR